MIPDYPTSSVPAIKMRDELHPFFKMLKDGVSEFTFANIYLFRDTHDYKISKLDKGLYVITGSDAGEKFFMLPFGVPKKAVLEGLFDRFSHMKCVPERAARVFQGMGYGAEEDRDNFDYLYGRKDMAYLAGRKFHKKKNMVNAFVANYSYEARPLLAEYARDAMRVLDEWRSARDTPGDYGAAREAIERMDELQLCGGVYYVDGRPAAYTLGEELEQGRTFVIHSEKGVKGYKGLMQFVSSAFASILPAEYLMINREQDLGIEGLRRTKTSLHPSGFIKKYRIRRRG